MNVSDFMRKIGAKGGKSTSKKYGSNYFSKLGKKGQAALKKKLASNENL